MAFNITGFTTLTVSVTREQPNTPTDLVIERINSNAAVLTWEHEVNIAAPHVGFRVEESSDNTTWNVLSVTGPDDTELEILGISEHTTSFFYRVTAVGANVGSRQLNSEPSSSVELALDAVDPTSNVRVNTSDENVDVITISWDYTTDINQISHFRVECQNIAENSPSTLLMEGDAWVTVGTVSANNAAVGTAQSYELMQTGYALEDDFVYYRVITVATNGIESDPSPLSNPPFSPNFPDTLSVDFERISVDVGELRWNVPDDVNFIETFVIEASIAGNPFQVVQNVSPQSSVRTINDQERYVYEIRGLANESDSITYRVFSVGTNDAEGDVSGGSATFTPLPPGSVSSTQSVVNSGVGLSTSVSLSWTRPVETNTLTTGFLVEYRRAGAGSWQQIGTYAPDVSSVEFLPPQQGAVEFRIITEGSNGLSSPPSAIISLIVTPGSATDDAIYNGDAAFIAQPHFSIDDDNVYLTYLPDSNPREGLLEANISNGTFTAPDATGIGYVDGEVGEDLTLEWRFPVDTDVVRRRRHFYLNLENVQPINNPTRVWDVDTGNVIIEVISDPTITNRFYETATDATYMFDQYLNPDSGELEDNPDANPANTRFYQSRATGATDLPMYVSRVQVRLSMRRVFTFRVASLSTLRVTFLADNVGWPRIPVIDPDTVDATASNALCLEAFASEVTETHQVTVTNPPNQQGTLAITFDNEYEVAPMIVATPQGPCSVWVTNVTTAGATLNILPMPGVADTSCLVNYTVRGY